MDLNETLPMAPGKQDQSPGHYHLSGTKHDLPPEDVRRAIKLPVDGDIDKWPAHATGRLYSSLTQHHNSKLKITTLKSINPIFDHTKPKFLSYLESYVRREMDYRNLSEEGVSVDRLQIYREVFDYLIEAFHSYSPILAAIKKEYDTVIEYYAENMRMMEPLKTKIYNLSADCDQKIIQIRENEKADGSKLMNLNKELKNEIADLQIENDELRHKVERITLVTEEEHQKYRDERDAKVILLLSQQNEADKAGMISRDEYGSHRVEIENLKISLCEAKKAHADAVQKISRIESKYSDVVSKVDFVSLTETNEQNIRDIRRLENALNEVNREKKELHALYGMAVEQRDNYYMKLMHALTGKTPDWMICAEFLGNMLNKWNQPDSRKKYDEFIEHVVEDIVLSESIEAESDDETPTARLARKRETLDLDAWRNARLIAEIIVDRIFDDNFSKPSTLTKVFGKFERQGSKDSMYRPSGSISSMQKTP